MESKQLKTVDDTQRQRGTRPKREMQRTGQTGAGSEFWTGALKGRGPESVQGQRCSSGRKGGDGGGKASLGGLAPLPEGMGREKAVGSCGFEQIKVIQMEWQTISVGWIIKCLLTK